MFFAPFTFVTQTSKGMNTNQVLLSPIALDELLNSFREIVKQEILSEQNHAVGERLLSPADTCALFQPSISKVTLSAWTKAGHLKKYDIGGRCYYRHSEVIEAAKTLKKYKPI